MDRAQALKRELQTEVEAFQSMQQDLQRNHRARKQFLQQKSENEMVMQELGLLEPEAAVYKLIGPALVRQEQDEAASNVRKRLEFIDAELKRLDGQLGGLEERQARKQAQVMQLQQELQRHQQPAAAT